MHLDKFVHSQTGRYLMSILLGIGLATMFRQVCKGRNCRIEKAPPLEEIADDNKVFKYNSQCYKLQKTAVSCDTSKKIVDIE